MGGRMLFPIVLASRYLAYGSSIVGFRQGILVNPLGMDKHRIIEGISQSVQRS